MKINAIDIFVIGSMIFFWYVFYPALYNPIDFLFYFGIPSSGFLCVIFMKVTDWTVEEKHDK